MAWQDRLREAAYTSPAGTRHVFDFEDVSREFDKKTAAFEFPDADGTFVQDLGHTGRRYPLRAYFWGPDHDLQAAAFEAALRERGVGKLEHPAYGPADVVPYGGITQRDDLKTAANQTVFEVSFWETIGLVYPVPQRDTGAAVAGALERFDEAAAEYFAEGVQIGGASARAAFRNRFTKLLDTARDTLRSVADRQEDVARQFNNVYDSIQTGIDGLIADPLTLAFQTVRMLQGPAQAAASVRDRLRAYRNLARSITSTPAESFQIDNLFASTAVTGSVLSALDSRFETKTAATSAAVEILAQFDELVAWRDANYPGVDVGEAYQALQEAVALTAGHLVELSFSLKQERRLVLDRARTIVDLAAELYGSVDDQLDFLITSNDLSGSEILELPKGRAIVYYV